MPVDLRKPAFAPARLERIRSRFLAKARYLEDRALAADFATSAEDFLASMTDGRATPLDLQYCRFLEILMDPELI